MNQLQLHNLQPNATRRVTRHATASDSQVALVLPVSSVLVRRFDDAKLHAAPRRTSSSACAALVGVETHATLGLRFVVGDGSACFRYHRTAERGRGADD